MAGEGAFWSWLRDRLPPGAHHQRLEDAVTVGIPDLNLCWSGRDYWLELKSIMTWPIRERTPVSFERYTREQQLWLRDRWAAGGAAFLLMRVATPGVCLAFRGPEAEAEVGRVSRPRLEALACGIWPVRGFSGARMLQDLLDQRRRWPEMAVMTFR